MVCPTHANAHAGSDGLPCLLPPLPRPDVHHPSFIGLYSRTMMDELREFFDQFYRLHTLRHHMHATFEKLWGAYVGAEVKYWRQLQEVVEIFRSVDLDGDGNLDQSELSQAFMTFGVHAHSMDCDNLLNVLDEDRSGEVDIQEFSDWYLSEADAWRAEVRIVLGTCINDPRNACCVYVHVVEVSVLAVSTLFATCSAANRQGR